MLYILSVYMYINITISSSKGVLRSQTYSAFSSDLKMAIDGKIGSIEVLQCNVNEKDEEIIWKKDEAQISKENFRSTI